MFLNTSMTSAADTYSFIKRTISNITDLTAVQKWTKLLLKSSSFCPTSSSLVLVRFVFIKKIVSTLNSKFMKNKIHFTKKFSGVSQTGLKVDAKVATRQNKRRLRSKKRAV